MKALLKKILPARFRRFLRDIAQIVVYATPNPIVRHNVQLNPKAQSWYDALRRDGICKIESEPEFERIADYLEQDYFAPIEKDPGQFLGKSGPIFPFGDRERFLWDYNNPLYASGGTEISCYISFLDSKCNPLYLNDDLSRLLLKYYGRQPYMRNQPLLQKVAMKPGQMPIDNGNFHVDHMHQISMMLLVNDVDESNTHMEYCVGSHRRALLREGVELSVDECRPKVGSYPVCHCVGRKGTLFVFDTTGFHRANYISNSTRKMLHLTITTGHHINFHPYVKFVDRKESFAALAAAPGHVRRMFQHLNGAYYAVATSQ